MKKMLTGKRSIERVALAALLCVVLAFTCGGLKGFSAFAAPPTFKADYATFAEEQAAAGEFNVKLAEESFTLFKNNGTLPLAGEAVSVFGVRSDYIQQGGGGSGSGSGVNPVTTLKQALEPAGFRLNPALVAIYDAIPNNDQNLAEKPVPTVTPAESTFKYYDDAAIIVISRTGSEFSDAALYNVAGHTDKLDHTYSLDDNEKALVNYVTGKFDNVVVIVNSAHPIELAVLQDDPGVDSILWIGHTGNNGLAALGGVLRGDVNPSGRTVDVYPSKFSADPTWANFKDNIQSRLVKNGSNALVIDDNGNGVWDEGETTPAPTAPAGGPWGPPQSPAEAAALLSYSRFVNPDGTYISADGPANGAQFYAALDYEEGIYMGYRWYETAFAESALADSNDYYNRTDGVVYPFGHGLSYTDFEWTLASSDTVEITDGTKDADVTIKVTVKNKGTAAGKDVVQAYWSPKYVDGKIEKAAVNLVGFAKTGLLQPGQSQTVKITFAARDLASFDYTDANANGFAGYELEDLGSNAKDDGVITLRSSSHIIGANDNGTDDDDLTVDVAVTGQTVGTTTTIKYETDAATGTAISPLFTGDGTWDGTRSDGDYSESRYVGWMNGASTGGTDYWKRSYFGDAGKKIAAPTADELKLSADAKRIMNSQVYYTSFNDMPTDPWYKTEAQIDALKVTTGAGADAVDHEWTQAANTDGRTNGKTAISLSDMGGVTLDTPEGKAKWIDFMNQLTYAEMVSLIRSNGFNTPALDSVGKPASTDQDGPAQLRPNGTFWVCEVNIASTYNVDLAYQQGVFVGNESLFMGTQGWYGPGLNIHRNPAAGRNFEYYSQDGIQGGLIAAAVIGGARSKGIVTYMKHLFLNDQETSRYTASTFVTEQALREQYAKPWELAIKLGGANASMSAFNKVGLLSTTSHYNLYQKLLCEEFGMYASSVTDMFGWNYCPGSSGDMAARVSITPLGSWNNTFGRNIEGAWDAAKQTVVVTFNRNITEGNRWTSETASVAMNAGSPGDINAINGGASAAYKPTASEPYNMKTDRTGHLYANGDTLDSYTQWYAVRQAAQKLLYVQANANTMKNGVLTNPLTAAAASLKVFRGMNANVPIPKSLPGGHTAVYSLAGGSLPAGVTLSAAGSLTGTTTAMAGSEYTFTVKAVVDGWIGTNNVYTRTYTVAVSETLAASAPLSAESNAAFSATIAPVAGSGVDPGANVATYGVKSGALPSGVTLAANGTLSGTPTAAGTYNFTVELTWTTPDQVMQWGDMQFVIPGQTFRYPSDFTMTVAEGEPAPAPQVVKYNVTFNQNYTDAASIVKAVESGSVADAATVTRDGYLFAGWYTDSACTSVADLNAAVTADKTVYAKWVAIQSGGDGDEKKGGCGSELGAGSAILFSVIAGLAAVTFVALARTKKQKKQD
ncbi:MAG: glycoside hydrolase family 3 C-terminal domain-containing protein [Clostridiales bacterium]|jgi:beta-glucosidase|nr:glycoside hydrolase family 3 C-terminal domain-containing protein [Clostridiales bacterium]